MVALAASAACTAAGLTGTMTSTLCSASSIASGAIRFGSPSAARERSSTLSGSRYPAARKPSRNPATRKSKVAAANFRGLGWLLGVGSTRPRDGRAAEQCDEVPALQMRRPTFEHRPLQLRSASSACRRAVRVSLLIKASQIHISLYQTVAFQGDYS